MRREGKSQGVLQTQAEENPCCLGSVRAEEEEMPLAAQSRRPPRNYLQPYQEEQGAGNREISQRHTELKSSSDKYISVMITNTEPYTTPISDKPQPLLILQSNYIAEKGLSVLDGSCDA